MRGAQAGTAWGGDAAASSTPCSALSAQGPLAPAATAGPHLGALGLRQLRQPCRQQLPIHALLEVVAAGLDEREVQLAGRLRVGGTRQHRGSAQQHDLLARAGDWLGGTGGIDGWPGQGAPAFSAGTAPARRPLPQPTWAPQLLPEAASRSRRSTCAVSRRLPPTNCQRNCAASTPCSSSTPGACAADGVTGMARCGGEPSAQPCSSVGSAPQETRCCGL